MTEEILEIVKTKDNKRLNEFYTNSLLMLTELVQYKNAYATDVEKLVINEIGAAVNLILDAMLPLGYALRQSYFDSIGILDLYNLSFNDLFIKDDFNINNCEILKIKSFLDNVSVNRNEVYEKICNIGGTYPEYFEEREEILKNAHFSNIEELYSFIENEELFGISKIMQLVCFEMNTFENYYNNYIIFYH